MFSRFTILFDANTLYSALLRDLILELGIADLFSPKWTNRIHDEWIRNLKKNRPDISLEKLENTKNKMNESIEDSLVEDYASLMKGIELPDPNDRHVVAAAIKSGAQIIVTYNLKHFPNTVLNKYGIEAQHPDDFLLNQIDLDKSLFLEGIKNILGRLKNPPKDISKYIGSLKEQSLIKTAEFLENQINFFSSEEPTNVSLDIEF